MPKPDQAAVIRHEHVLLPKAIREDASIVIVGNRGVGTSTLALILSMTLGWTLVDVNELFQQRYGLSRNAFQEARGSVEYRTQQSKLMQSVLEENGQRSVIVCGPVCLDGQGPDLLRKYASSHLVLQITRDRNWIQSYLGANAGKAFLAFSHHVDEILRSCTNCEYYNLFQGHEDEEHESQSEEQFVHKAGPPSLRLKKVAHNFLVFTYRILGKELPGYPSERERLSLAPELRPYTYAMEIPLSSLGKIKLDAQCLEPRADVFELIVEIPTAQEERHAFATHGVDIISESIACLRRFSDAPIVYHVILPDLVLFNDGTESSKALQLYKRLLLHGLRLACEYVTIDLRLPDDSIMYFTSIKASTKVIGHFIDRELKAYAWHSVQRRTVYERSKRLNCDLSRILQSATSREDNFEVQEFACRVRQISQPRPELIAYNTGTAGRTSCVFNRTFTPVSPRSLEGTMHAPLLTLQQAQLALFTAFVLDPLKFSVLGSDISYSLVPDMFHAAFKACGMPHTFTLTPSQSLAGLAPHIGSDQYGGGTCAPPFKTSVIEHMDIISPSASLIGAVNTIIALRFNPDSTTPENFNTRYKPSCAGQVKALFGDNTDWIGIISCINRSLSPANAIKADTTALVVGAGGMARAAIFAMMKLGIRNVFILNRTVEKAHRLVQLIDHVSTKPRLEVKSAQQPAQEWPLLHVLQPDDKDWPMNFHKPTIIVSCVPQNTVVELPDLWTQHRTGGVFVQGAYKTLRDPLLRQFETKAGQGWVVQDGLDVLPEQAFPQFELFTGRPAPKFVMKETALRNYRDDSGMPLSEYDIQRRLKSY